MEILSKDTIEQYILPKLSIGSRGKECDIALLTDIASSILYRLKIGCQWRQLPVKQFFSTDVLTWQGVYYHFNKWVKSDGRCRWLLDKGLDKHFSFKPPAFRLVFYPT